MVIPFMPLIKSNNSSIVNMYYVKHMLAIYVAIAIHVKLTWLKLPVL